MFGVYFDIIKIKQTNKLCKSGISKKKKKKIRMQLFT